MTVVDDEDLKAWGQFSNVSLSERYHAARDHVEAAAPPIHSVSTADLERPNVRSGYVDVDEEDPFHSNVWAISGKLTDNGFPLFATDPHLGASLPSAWI